MRLGFFGRLLAGAAVIMASRSAAGAQVTGNASSAVRSPVAQSAARNTGGPAGRLDSTQKLDSTRKYDSQALRFETNWGNVMLIRGPDGPVLGTAGWFRDFDLEKLLASSPAAAADVRAFRTDNFRGSLVGGIGAATTLVGVIVTANRSNNASSPVLIIGGIGAMVWGAQHLSMSYSALSRALWWYNRDVSR
jgi:hypothetical protein